MRNPSALLLPLLLLVSGCTTIDPEPSPSTSAPPGSADARWESRSPLPVPRTEVSCVAVGDDIYVLGGFEESNTATAFFHRYNRTTDDWTQLPPFPHAIHHTGLAFHDGDIYVLGGYTGNFPFLGTNTVWRFDLGANGWSVAGTLPEARGAHATIQRGSHVFLVGGAPQQPGQETYRSVVVYDLETNSATAGPALSQPREHLAGAAASNVIVAAGGRRMSLNNFDLTETLAPGAAAWSVGEPMPTARGGIAAAARDSKVFIVGGESASDTFDQVEAFDVAENSWSTWPPLPRSRHGLCAATLPDGIHVIGGGPEPGLTVSADHDVLVIEKDEP